MNLFRNPRSNARVLIGIAAVVVLAACGSSSKATVTPGAQPSASTTPTTVASPSATAGAVKPVVMTAMTAKFGSVLVDSKGMTLYTLTNAGTAVACTGQCATFWPPLLLSSSTPKAVGATGVTGLGSTSGETGNQVTENGLPLYRFSKDKAPGDTNGDGISSFGGVWHVVAASGSAPSASTATTTPPTSAPAAPAPTSGYGY